VTSQLTHSAERKSGAWWPRSLPGPVPTIAAIATVIVCVMMGNWQRSRMHEKDALHAQFESAADAPAVPLPSGVADWSSWRFRKVQVVGRFDAPRQFMLDNRVHDGKVGFDVVAPLAMSDGRAVLVDRGFVAGGPSRAQLPSVPPPQGDVAFEGRINLPPAGYYELGEERPDSPIREHLDPARIAKATGLPLLPIVIEMTTPGGDDGLLRNWPLPDTGSAKHQSYMLQWYTFATLAGGAWIGFTVRRMRELAHKTT
jgi:surfeit locus 1 family protein